MSECEMSRKLDALRNELCIREAAYTKLKAENERILLAFCEYYVKDHPKCDALDIADKFDLELDEVQHTLITLIDLKILGPVKEAE